MKRFYIRLKTYYSENRMSNVNFVVDKSISFNDLKNQKENLLRWNEEVTEQFLLKSQMPASLEYSEYNQQFFPDTVTVFMESQII